MRRILLALLPALMLQAQITLEQIGSKPPSRAKNFLIWQFFKQKITPKEAEKAFYQIQNVGINELYMYAAKTDDKSVKYTTRCLSASPKSLVKLKDVECLELALSPYKFTKIAPKERKALYKKVTRTKMRRWMKAMEGKKIADIITAPTLLEVFVRAGSDYRYGNFNRPYSRQELENLSKEPRFKQFVAYSVLDPKMQRTQKALLHVSDNCTLDAETNFLIGLNALRYGKKAKAEHHFKSAYMQYYYQADKDKALFWRYKLNGDDTLLKTLSESFDINIYTLYAREKLGQPLGNYYASLDVDVNQSPQDITDPFEWLKILDEVKATPQERLSALGKKYDDSNLLGVQSFIHERSTKYREQGFITPYRNYLSDLDTDTQALMYALMRQESRFIPSALSRSYAMGLMQMMPFLVRDMEKKMPRKLKNLNEMFEPKTNLTYAKKHLLWLKESYYHPLFIAYSYNGGYGFTRKHISGEHFKAGPYEPYMSLELMLNRESREYGKKVLANYVVYKEILGEDTSLLELLSQLDNPKKTDRFRD